MKRHPKKYWVGRYLYSVPKRKTGLVAVEFGDHDLLPPTMLDYLGVEAFSKKQAIRIYRGSGRWYATHSTKEPAVYPVMSDS